MKSILLLLAGVLAAAETRSIPNPLGQDWPWELVSMDFAPGVLQDGWVASIDGVDGPRPIQIERLQSDDKAIERVWFIATLARTQKEATVTFAPGRAASSLRIACGDGFTTVDTGVAELRLRLGSPAAGTPLSDVPHWLGGVRVKGQETWDGRARFDGNATVAAVQAQQIAAGPVFAEWRLTYAFSDPGRSGTVEAVPLMLGKHSFRYPPNRIPTETIPKDERRYEVAIRAIAGSPWIEVAERYRLPRDKAIATWGAHQYTITLGKPTEHSAALPGFVGDGMPLDTMLWTRWFDYDAFGGNNNQTADPATPRAVQRGRPFAQLRPRWAQSPAGAQECIATSGGVTAFTVAEMRKRVEDRLEAVRKEEKKGEKAEAKMKPFLPAIASAAALLAKAGDDSDAARRDLAEAAKQLGLDLPVGSAYRADAPAIGVVAAYPSKWIGPYDGTITVQVQDNARASYRFPLVDGGRNLVSGQPNHYGGRCWALLAGPRGRFDSTGKIDDLVRRSTDWTLTALINRYILAWDGMGPGKVGPNPMMYLGKRYQCDDVNPTNYGNRRLVNQNFEKNLDKAAEFGQSAAVCGYIYTDLDSWPGWHNGWGPGNPNFHTDKYMAALYAAVTLKNHPHAKDWLAFGRSCLDDDLAKVMTAPDGVGSECPGYSGYSLGLQATVAHAVLKAGLGNALAENPLVAKTITWHRKLLTPFDHRLGLRHEAPIGDTHRWTSGMKPEELLPFYEKDAPATAAELRGAQALLKAKGPGAEGTEQLDWGSQAFSGFGAILRHRFGEAEESFLTLKAGSTSGHYHNEDQTFHWYHRGTPIALDYNCSYHPRGDHAALHNGITLGSSGTVKHNGRNADVVALEQPFGPANTVYTAFTATADLVVSDRQIRSLAMSPLDPHDSEFNREYPSRSIDAGHRRLLLLSKHAAQSPLSDYLVVRDEIRTTEPQQVNLHVLARDARIEGNHVLMTGQWDQDILVAVVEATDLQIEHRQWNYTDEWMAPPEEWLPKAGETTAAWDARLPKERPAAGWKPTFVKREGLAENEKRWHEVLTATDGMAVMPPPGWTGTWIYGECQRWLRFSTRPGTPVTIVVYPYRRGGTVPVIARDGETITITVDGTTERIVLGSNSGAILGTTRLLDGGKLGTF
jgi:hypothetical protein